MRRAAVVLAVFGLTALGAAVIDRPPPLWPRGRVSGNSLGPPAPYVDAGFPGFPPGTYSWGGECVGLLPTSASALVPFGGSRGGVGNVATCCKASGACVEMIGGGDPSFPNESNYVDRGGIPEVAVELQEGTSNEFGVVVEYPSTNWVLYSRDWSNGAWSGSATFTANTDVGPFGSYLGANEMNTLNDTSGAASQDRCQTVSVSLARPYGFSVWLKAGTATSARLSMVGTGNSAGDHECTKTGLSSGTYGARYGCIGPSYGAGLTAITICVKVGAVDGDTGTIKVSDAQLEDDFEGVGVVSSYIPTTSAAVTRLQSGFSFDYPTAEMSKSEGCIGSGLARKRYDAEDYFFLTISGVSDQTRANQYYTPTKLLQLDGTNNTLLTVPSIFSGYQYGVSGWSADSGLQTTWMDGGTDTTAFTGSMFAASSSITLGSTQGGLSNSFVGRVGPIIWGNGDTTCRSNPPVRNADGSVLLVSDGMSSIVNTNGYVNPASWADRVTEVYIRNPSNNGLQWTHTANATSGEFARWKYSKFNSTLWTKLIWWNGQNDITQLGMDGGDLYNEMNPYVTRKGALGIPTYWFNLSPLGGSSGLDGGQVANISLFNRLFAAYCVSPPTNVKCLDVYSVLVVPDGGTALNPLYDYGNGIYLNAAGEAAVAAAFEAIFP